MFRYLKKYPVSLCIVAAIFYLSFFTPPQTDMDGIPGIDKLVHICMYGGLCFMIWTEYLFKHNSINFRKAFCWGIIAPIAMSGVIELLQTYCTENRGGEWMDLLANSTGVVLAALFGYYVMRPLIWKRLSNGR